jgi:hypothetical protein
MQAEPSIFGVAISKHCDRCRRGTPCVNTAGESDSAPSTGSGFSASEESSSSVQHAVPAATATTHPIAARDIAPRPQIFLTSDVGPAPWAELARLRANAWPRRQTHRTGRPRRWLVTPPCLPVPRLVFDSIFPRSTLAPADVRACVRGNMSGFRRRYLGCKKISPPATTPARRHAAAPAPVLIRPPEYAWRQCPGHRLFFPASAAFPFLPFSFPPFWGTPGSVMFVTAHSVCYYTTPLARRLAVHIDLWIYLGRRVEGVTAHSTSYISSGPIHPVEPYPFVLFVSLILIIWADEY